MITELSLLICKELGYSLINGLLSSLMYKITRNYCDCYNYWYTKEPEIDMNIGGFFCTKKSCNYWIVNL